MTQPVDTTDEPREGDIVVPPGDAQLIDAATEIVTPPDDGRPMEGAHLEYASAAPPPYPREAVINGLTGTVMLRVLVDVDGKPLEVSIQRSSGHRVLDAAARRQVLSKWRFRPAMRNGQAVQAIGVVPVEFKLD
jgi:protein TonB